MSMCRDKRMHASVNPQNSTASCMFLMQEIACYRKLIVRIVPAIGQNSFIATYKDCAMYRDQVLGILGFYDAVAIGSGCPKSCYTSDIFQGLDFMR